MDAKEIEAREVVPASRKLGREEAAAIVAGSDKVIVAKGKKVSEYTPGEDGAETIVAAMLGPTGNLRAPTIRQGKLTLVGFSEEVYERALG